MNLRVYEVLTNIIAGEIYKVLDQVKFSINKREGFGKSE